MLIQRLLGLDAWPGLKDIVLRMMAPNPTDRPTATELLSELQA